MNDKYDQVIQQLQTSADVAENFGRSLPSLSPFCGSESTHDTDLKAISPVAEEMVYKRGGDIFPKNTCML